MNQLNFIGRAVCVAVCTCVVFGGVCVSVYGQVIGDVRPIPDNPNEHFYVGYSGTGSVIGPNQWLTTRRGYIGYQAGAVGNVDIQGSNGHWVCGDWIDPDTSTQCYGDLFVGHRGTGTLNVLWHEGIYLESPLPPYEVLIDIPPGGGTVECSDLNVGTYSGSSGTVTVDGEGTTLTARREIWVGGMGSGGTGLVEIRGGGAVNCDVGFVCSDGTMTVSGVGTTCSQTRNLLIGTTGTTPAMVNIQSGGLISTGESASISWTGGSEAEVIVDGAGSQWIVPDLDVGNYGTGSLSITNGGTVTSSGDGSVGSVTVDGEDSTWTNRNWLIVGANGNGTLTIRNSGTVSSAQAAIGRWHPTTEEPAVTGTPVVAMAVA